MTTILGIVTDKSVFLGSDTQITLGNLKLASVNSKIEIVGKNCAVAQTGSLAGLQQALKRTVQQLWIRKILARSGSLEVTPKELADGLSDFNFEMPLEYKDYSPAQYLLAGYEGSLSVLSSIGADGSVLDCNGYHADGSGQQLALSLLQAQYDHKMPDEKVANLLRNILNQVSRLEVHTSTEFGADIFMLKEDDKTKEPGKPKSEEGKNER